MMISLTPAQQKFVEEKVRCGDFGSAEEVVATAIALFEADPLAGLPPEELEELRREIAIGIAQADKGELSPWNVIDIKADVQKRLSSQQKAC